MSLKNFAKRFIYENIIAKKEHLIDSNKRYTSRDKSDRVYEIHSIGLDITTGEDIMILTTIDYQPGDYKYTTCILRVFKDFFIEIENAY